MGDAQHLIPALEGHRACWLAKSSGKPAGRQPGPAQTGCAPCPALTGILWAQLGRLREKKLTHCSAGSSLSLSDLAHPHPSHTGPSSRSQRSALVQAQGLCTCLGLECPSLCWLLPEISCPLQPHLKEAFLSAPLPLLPLPADPKPLSTQIPLFVSWRMCHSLV